MYFTLTDFYFHTDYMISPQTAAHDLRRFGTQPSAAKNNSGLINHLETRPGRLGRRTTAPGLHKNCSVNTKK
jgi:hypothetical protein